MLEALNKVLLQNGLVTAFAVVGVTMWVSMVLSRRLTFGHIHGSAIAIVIGLILAYIGGIVTGGVSLLLGTIIPFIVGAGVARALGYSDPVSMTTIGAGAVTYIVGPVTGAAIGASSDVMALSIATGLIKAIIVMVGTPFAARFLGLKTPRSAMIFGGLAGTVSGVSAGLAATDRRLVPYGALVATFHTGIGCLLGPSVLFLVIKALFG